MSYFKEKELMEDRGKVLDEQENLLKTAENENRDLTGAEQRRYDALQKKEYELTNEIDDMMAKREESDRAEGAGMSQLFTGNGTSGRALNESGSVRLYQPHEKISTRRDSDQIGLGQFLRACMDKPRNAMERETLNRALGSSGYSMPEHVAKELIDLLRAENVILNSGGQSIVINGLDNTKFVKHVADSTAVWHVQNVQEDFSDPVFTEVTAVPRTVLALCEVSRELMQDSQNIEQALVNNFVGSLNSAIMTAAFEGTGGADPAGLSSQVTQEENYTTSATHLDFLTPHKTLFDNNVKMEGRSHIISPDIWKDLAELEDTVEQRKGRPYSIEQVPEHVSSACPEGTAYIGDMSNCAFTWRLDISLEQHNAPAIRKYASTYLAVARLDFLVFRPSAIVRLEKTT